jgi:hypothetical protein
MVFGTHHAIDSRVEVIRTIGYAPRTRNMHGRDPYNRSPYMLTSYYTPGMPRVCTSYQMTRALSEAQTLDSKFSAGARAAMIRQGHWACLEVPA